MKDIPEGGSDLSGSGLGKPVPWEPTGRVDSACILEGLTCQGDSLDMMQCDRAMCRGGHFRARGKAVHVPFQKLKPTPLSMGPAEVFGGVPTPHPHSEGQWWGGKGRLEGRGSHWAWPWLSRKIGSSNPMLLQFPQKQNKPLGYWHTLASTNKVQDLNF